MAVTAAAASPPLDANVLCAAFNATLDPCPKTRKEAESVLSQLSLTPGLLLLVSTIVTNVTINAATRTAAALFLKNEVRRHWRSKQLGYSEEEKSAFRELLVLLPESLLSEGVPVAITNSVDDCVRCIAHADFPEKWPTVFPHVVEQLRLRASVNSVKASLLVLRRLVKKYEYRCSEEKEEVAVSDIVRVSFPLLLTLADQCRERNCFADEASAWIMTIICKIYWSSTQMLLATGDVVEGSFDDWMRLMEHIITTFVPESVLAAYPEASERSTLQAYKAKKWALQIIHRFLVRCGPHTFVEKSKKDAKKNLLGDHFLKNWSGKFIECLIRLLETERIYGVWLTDRMKNLILQYLTQGLELSLTYTSIRPHVEFILYEVCFPLLCYTAEDVAKWESDPAEFIRSHGVLLSTVPRDSAVEFIQTLARLRGRDFFEPISDFGQNILVAHQAATAADQAALHNQRKDGALFLIGSIADRLTSKKRQLQVEPFLLQFVFPELSNGNDPFLRLRACWTYRQFLDTGVEKFEKPEALNEAFLKVVDLCKDPQLPIRVEASTTLKSFFNIKQDEIRKGVVAHIPQLMENLLKLMTEVPDNENIVETLESLVLNFETEIPTYAIDLVRYLSSTLLTIINASNKVKVETDEIITVCSPTSTTSSSYDEENCGFTAMSVASAIMSVVSTLTEPQFRPLFEQICPHVTDLLDVMLSPAGLDLVDEGLAMLTYFTFYCPNLSTPTDLWRYYERCYQAVCGGGSSHLELEGVCAGGWAPDSLCEMLPSLDNFISRDKDRFLNGVSSIGGKTYKQLFLEMVKKCIVTMSSSEVPKSATELMMLLFEGFVGSAPAVDDLMEACFQVLIDNIATLQTNKAIVVRLLSTMVIYNPIRLLQLAESRGLIDEVFRIFSEVDSVRTYEGKRVVVLALAQLLEVSSNSAPGKALPSAHTANIVKSIATQLRQSVDLKKKQIEDEFEDESDDSDDSEQDIGEHEDAGSQIQQTLAKVIQQAAEEEKEDEDDESSDEDYYETEAVTDNFPVRDSPVDKINELEIVASLLQRMPVVFTEVLGATDAGLLQQYIVAEDERRKAPPPAGTEEVLPAA